MDGILLVDKPEGWTSFDVVAKFRGIVRRETGQKKPKIGHTGTLDPLATGLLVLLLGSYTKRAAEFSKLDKSYDVTMVLGRTSTTGDREGDITVVSDKKPTDSQISSILQQFIGVKDQVPPAYSAIKVNGQRAYKLARAGKEVALEHRKVTIYSNKLNRYAYPEVQFTVRVSSGTYIRSLVEDIGNELGVGAYMSSLCRTSVGNFSLEKALEITELEADTIRVNLNKI
jgi:tRNA pseudouridine55 synthase